MQQPTSLSTAPGAAPSHDSANAANAPNALATPLAAQIAAHIAQAGGWVGFDAFMHWALYAPGQGYYARGNTQIGPMPETGSDFVTAPELSPVFGQTLAVAVAEALRATGCNEVWEFGAGSGALAEQVLDALDALVGAGSLEPPLARYTIVDVSGSLRARQQQRLQRFGDRVRWVDALPARMQGVVVGNEVLDAMPVKLLARLAGRWHERGVVVAPAAAEQGVSTSAPAAFAWADRPTDLRPPCAIDGNHDYLTEIHPQATAFVRTLADRLERGAAFLIDYGFPEAEYYHPQRHMGTVMCHRAHVADTDPLADVGDKDITAHIDFTGIAVAAQDAGLQVLGYTSQAHFLVNAGLLSKMELLAQVERGQAAKLMLEHEMGELFKVIALGAGPAWEPLGFALGDRSHRL